MVYAVNIFTAVIYESKLPGGVTFALVQGILTEGEGSVQLTSLNQLWGSEEETRKTWKETNREKEGKREKNREKDREEFGSERQRKIEKEIV